MILAVKFDFRARIFAEQDLVSRLDPQGDHLAILMFPGTDSDDTTFLRLLFRRIGYNDTPLVFSSSSIRLIMTLSCKGRIFVAI